MSYCHVFFPQPSAKSGWGDPGGSFLGNSAGCHSLSAVWWNPTTSADGNHLQSSFEVSLGPRCHGRSDKTTRQKKKCLCNAQKFQVMLKKYWICTMSNMLSFTHNIACLVETIFPDTKIGEKWICFSLYANQSICLEIRWCWRAFEDRSSTTFSICTFGASSLWGGWFEFGEQMTWNFYAFSSRKSQQIVKWLFKLVNEFSFKCSLLFRGRIIVSDERSMFLAKGLTAWQLGREKGGWYFAIWTLNPVYFDLFGWTAMDVAEDLYSISFQESGMLLGMKMPGCTLMWAQCFCVFRLCHGVFGIKG